MGRGPALDYLLPGMCGCLWPHPIAPGIKCHCLPRPSGSKAYPVLKAIGQSDWMVGLVPGQGGKQNGLSSGEILPAHGYHNEGSDGMDYS
jgi:hypothetical protein